MEKQFKLNPIKSLFTESWQQYKEQFATLAEIFLIPSLIMLAGLIFGTMGSSFSAIGNAFWFAGELLLYFSIVPVIYAINHKADLDGSYQATISLFWPYVWVVLIYATAAIGSFFMLFVPGIWLTVAASFATYVFVLEDRRGVDALRQSKDYVKGYWWAIVGRIILIDLIVSVTSVIISGIFYFFGGVFMQQIAVLIMTLVTGPFTAIYSYKIYQNLRTLKPDVVAMPKPVTTGRKFIITSSIVGVVVPVLLVVVLSILIIHGVISGNTLSHAFMNGYNGGVTGAPTQMPGSY